VELPGQSGAVVHAGVLHAAWVAGRTIPALTPGPQPDVPDGGDPESPLSRELADEVATIAGWLDAQAGRVRVVECERDLAWPLPRLPSFDPAR
jgi:hypothetical protein